MPPRTSWAYSPPPTFFVNGEKVAGNIGFEAFKKLLDKKLKKMGIEAPEEKESSGL